MTPFCYGFTGRGGAGKSTTAKAIERLDGKCIIRPVGYPLKAMMRAYYRAAGLDDATIDRKLDGDLKRVACELLGGKTPTYAMQTLGTEWGRDLICPTLWLDRWVERAGGLIAKGLRPINDSVRFENEAAAIRRFGGIVVRIEAPSDIDADHPSEAGVVPDIVVERGDRKPLEVAREVQDKACAFFTARLAA